MFLLSSYSQQFKDFIKQEGVGMGEPELKDQDGGRSRIEGAGLLGTTWKQAPSHFADILEVPLPAATNNVHLL